MDDQKTAYDPTHKEGILVEFPDTACSVKTAADEASGEMSNQPQDTSSDTSFKSLKKLGVSDNTLKAINELGFSHMTEIQHDCIPPLLEGRDLFATANTGSGKILAFLIPAIELINKLKFMPCKGTGAIIISPTTELAMQTYGRMKDVMKYHDQHTYGFIMGFTHGRRAEAEKLRNGVNIIVATPRGLLKHLQRTDGFAFHDLQCLIIDGADRILEVGFEDEMKKILRILPRKRQTMLFSATQTNKVENLAKMSLIKWPIRFLSAAALGADDNKDQAIVEGFEQAYVVSPSEIRFRLLLTFLRRNPDKKIIVFFSSCMSVKFHFKVLIDMKEFCLSAIHGRQKQTTRTDAFVQFCDKKNGILLCTNLAARGLDIPEVDWIVQYDPPDDPKEYIHRVGKTANVVNGKGHALLILLPHELGFLRYLRQAKMVLSEFDFQCYWTCQDLLVIVQNNFYSNSAEEAYSSYVRAYASHSLKNIYDVQKLDLVKVGLYSFGTRNRCQCGCTREKDSCCKKKAV